MKRSWRVLLSILVALALSWQGLASASMVQCHGKATAHASGQGHDASQGHAHGHDHAAGHGHDHVQADADADADADVPADHHACAACAACAWCCHALGLQPQVTAWPLSIPPSQAEPLAVTPLAMRVSPLPDKPPRA